MSTVSLMVSKRTRKDCLLEARGKLGDWSDGNWGSRGESSSLAGTGGIIPCQQEKKDNKK